MSRAQRANILFAAVQALYWTAFLSVISFASAQLLGMGYSGAYAGAVLAAGNVAALVMQPALAARSDADARLGPINVTAALVLATLVCAVSQLTWASGGWALLALGAVQAACMVTACSFGISVKFQLGDDVIDFGACRAAGSLAYSLASVALGFALSEIGARAVPLATCASCAALLLILSLCARAALARAADSPRADAGAAEGAEGSSANDRSLLAFLARNRRLALLVAGVSLLFLDHSLVNNFSIYVVEGVGGTSSEMGVIVGVTALLELPVLFGYARLRRRARCSTLMLVSIVSFTVKAFATWLAPNVALLSLAFALQVFAYALYVPASVDYATLIASESDQVKAQTCFTLTTTVGAIISSLAGGALLDAVGVSSTLLLAAAASLAGTIIAAHSLEQTS